MLSPIIKLALDHKTVTFPACFDQGFETADK